MTPERMLAAGVRCRPSVEEIARMKELGEQGMKLIEVARELGVSTRTAWYHCTEGGEKLEKGLVDAYKTKKEEIELGGLNALEGKVTLA